MPTTRQESHRQKVQELFKHVFSSPDTGSLIGENLDCNLVIERGIGGEYPYEWILPMRPSYYDEDTWRRMSCQHYAFPHILNYSITNALQALGFSIPETKNSIYELGFFQDDLKLFRSESARSLIECRTGYSSRRFDVRVEHALETKDENESQKMTINGRCWIRTFDEDMNDDTEVLTIANCPNLPVLLEHMKIVPNGVIVISVSIFEQCFNDSFDISRYHIVYKGDKYLPNQVASVNTLTGQLDGRRVLRLEMTDGVYLEADEFMLQHDGRIYAFVEDIYVYLKKECHVCLVEQMTPDPSVRCDIFIKNVWILTHALHDMANPLRTLLNSMKNKERIKTANLTFRTGDNEAFAYIQCKRFDFEGFRTNWALRQIMWISNRIMTEVNLVLPLSKVEVLMRSSYNNPSEIS